jgi:metallophosphoesterase superfamily enzyme
MENLEEVAKIAGKLVKTDGKISTTRFNYMYTRLGYDKVGRGELKDYMRAIQSDSVLLGIYNDALVEDIDYNDVKGNLVSASQVRPDVSTDIVDREFNRASVRNYKKYQKEGAIQEGLSEMVADRLAEELVKVVRTDENYYKESPVNFVHGENTLIIALSDWHIGATVKAVNGNSYNVEIAKDRLARVMSEAKRVIEDYKVEDVYIGFLGDAVENTSMRNINQAFDAEINMAEQIALATRMLAEFIKGISEVANNVTAAVIGGNHDRYTPNKKEAIYNDNVAYNILDSLLMLQEYGGLSREINIIDNRYDIYSAEFTVYDKTIRLVHGDNLPNNDKPKIPIMIKDHPIDYVFFGHYHSSKIIQENGSATGIMVGSLQGNNTYSKQLNLPDSRASQTMVLFNEDHPESPMYYPVFL